MNTRKSDEELLIQFVEDQGFDEPDLVMAANRLKDAIAIGLNNYSCGNELGDDGEH